jgi:lipopolysaccharide export system protein LptA
MTASGDQPGQVHTLLVSVGKDAASEARPDTKVGAAKGGPLKSSDGPRAVRIASSGLTYIEASRLADFTGGVTVQSADGTMRSREALVYLQPSGVQEGTQVAATSGTLGTATGAGIGLDGRVERIVATGDVAVDQPGRRAAGERLVYTASDRVFVLTAGSGGVAKVIDTRGTTMGAAFRFHSGDESVEALNAAPGEAASQRVRTEGDVADRKGLGTKR